MLDCYTVLDFTDERGELGPMLLGDLGADVIRVETPAGSAARRSGPVLAEAPQDLASLQFLAFNRNKRSIVLDPDDAADQAALESLIKRADFIFESAPELALARYGYDIERTRMFNERIIHVRISAFGEGGSYANYLGNDLVVAAMGGPVFLQGSKDRPPVRITAPQVWRHAGAEAAAGAMAAFTRMLRTGKGAFVDLSAQSVMTWTMLNAMDAYAIQGFDFQRVGSMIDNGAMRVELIHPTADGYLVAIPLSGVLQKCLPTLIERGEADPALLEIDWLEYDLNVMNPDHQPLNLAQGVELCHKFFALHSKQELLEFGLANDVSLAPVNTLSELLEMRHMREREYWHPVALPDGGTANAPGAWAKPGGSPLKLHRAAPALDQHGEEIRAELAHAPKPKSYPPADGPDVLPFEGLTVADFSWVGVGPISGKYLADHGANVIRIESENRPDVLRAGGPFKDAEQGWNRSQFYGDFNTSKQSITLDLKLPEAQEMARNLVAQADVLIESFTPGTIATLGLGYEQAREMNPGLIMISTCLMGQTGSASSLAGYGYHAGAIAGFCELIGWPDQRPSAPWVAYTDTIAPRFISTLLAAALDHRRRTGVGCHIDVAQIETALHFLAPELLDVQANGFLATRNGNRSRFHAPQGCYPCAGDDNWCAIAVDDDEQWQRLCREMGRQDWLDDAQLATHDGRLAQHDAIDDGIAGWSHEQDAHELMQRLQRAGVPAGAVQRSSDLLKDPQYAERHFYRYYDHPEMGHIPYAGHQYRISGYDSGPRGPAPLLGQHSFEVLSELLGMSDEEVAAAYASGAIT